MEVDHVNKAIVENYRKMRTRMGVMAAIFPVIVVIAGFVWGLGLQPTLSDYYYASDPVGTRIDPFPVRLWFCGILAIVGFFLCRYSGFSKHEDWWLNTAGIFVLGVAIFPMVFKDKTDFNPFAWIGLPWLSPHGVSAVLAFVCIAVVIFWYADNSLSELKGVDERAYDRYKKIYAGIAIYMALAIGTSVTLHYLNKKEGSWILVAEATGIWAFAAYWFVKNRELEEVRQVLKGEAVKDEKEKGPKGLRPKGPLGPRSKADIADAI